MSNQIVDIVQTLVIGVLLLRDYQNKQLIKNNIQNMVKISRVNLKISIAFKKLIDSINEAKQQQEN